MNNTGFKITCQKCGYEVTIKENGKKPLNKIYVHTVQESVLIGCDNRNCNNKVFV